MAANEAVSSLWAGLLTGAVQAELDGRIVGYAAAPDGRRQLLLARPDGLEWFVLPAAPALRVTLDFTFRGRVEGATGGTVQLYEEAAGQPRRLVGEFPVGPGRALRGAGHPHRRVLVPRPSTSIPRRASPTPGCCGPRSRLRARPVAITSSTSAAATSR